jgi:hypothetical protein
MLIPMPVRVGSKTDPQRVAWKRGKRNASEHPEHVPARFRRLRLRRRVRRRRSGAPVDAWVVIGVLIVCGLILGLPVLLG